MREHDERRLRAALQQEAERHRPDRDAMFERVIRNRAEKRRAVRPRLNPVAAAAGVAVVVVASFAGIRLAASDDKPDDQVAAPTPTASAPATPAPASSTPREVPAPGVSSGTLKAPSSKPSAGPSSTRGSSRSPQTPASTGAGTPSSTEKDGHLTVAAGINPNPNPVWSQADLIMTLTKEVTALEVTVTVKRTGGATTPGIWTTIPDDHLADKTYTEQGDTIVYHFLLKDGYTVAPGEYTFASQYNHEKNRPTSGDTWRVTATAGAEQASVRGTF
ncbi:hypothetical protein [Actinoplanes sp. RD1]|uniref:hypothetical protein n=1 Tax=Actinoplanes sp. RD1 TaxID=3064538 RepID=UPI0027420EFC|nr:hypothetical protein [Actinoplanes sp. RD1]